MSYDIVIEDVPQFTKRISDNVLEGSNNSILILGSDRSSESEADISSGYGHVNATNNGTNAGSFHAIVGRTSSNPNFMTDSAYMYLSMKTNADEIMSTLSTPSKHAQPSGISSACLMKSDSTRIVSRNDIKLVVGESSITITKDAIILDSKSIRFGANSKMNELERSSLLSRALATHKHPTPAGPSSDPAPDANIAKIQADNLIIKH